MSAEKYLSLNEIWNQYQIHRKHIRHLDYSHLPEEIMSSRQIIWHLMNDIVKIPKCRHPNCENNVKWITGSRKYAIFCSNKCVGSGAMEKRKKTNLEKYGVEYHIQSEEVQEKAKQTKLERFGVEHQMQSDKVKEKVKQTCYERYGVNNPSQSLEVKEKAKQTSLEKYGVENYFQSDEFKEKSKQTCLEKYGVEHTSQSEKKKEKTKQTNLEKYGVEHTFQFEEIKEKSKQTILKKYGVNHHLQLPEIQKKREATCLEKYGETSFSKTDEFNEKFKRTNLERRGVEHHSKSDDYREKVKQTNLERFGTTSFSHTYYSEETREILLNKDKFTAFMKDKNKREAARLLETWPSTILGYIRKYNIKDYIHTSKSYLEDEMFAFLKEQNIEFIQNDRTQIKPWELDFYIPMSKIAIEMNGEHWHSDEFLLETRNMTANEYHQMKTDLCLSKGINLIHVSENEWNDHKKRTMQTIINHIQ